MADIVVIVILVFCVIGAGVRIYKNKKQGKGCLGCPDASFCGGTCNEKEKRK